MRCPKIVIVLLLVIHASLLGYCGWRQSPTLNEPSHLAAGIGIWQSGKFSAYKVNPPLVRLIAAIPAALLGCEGDFASFSDTVGTRPESTMGTLLVRENRNHSLRFIRMARLSVLPFSLLGVWICFRWAKELFCSDSAGLFAATLWSFSPMVIGNASLITPDAHSAAIGLAACYTFWNWLRRPSWRQAVLTGVVLGVAELSKTTLIIFYPLWPILWVAYRWQDRREMSKIVWFNEAGMLAVRMIVGLYILNLGYLGAGSFTQLRDYKFVSQLFIGQPDSSIGNRFADTWLGHLPVPLPADYLEGIDLQQRDFERFAWPSYLRGEYKETGWWYFYIYAILVKAPMGTLGLFLLAIVTSIMRSAMRIPLRDTLVLLVPPVVILLIVSSKYGFSHHSRYILPGIPFVFVWIGGQARLVVELAELIRDRWNIRQLVLSKTECINCLFGLGVLLLASWTIVSSMLVYPHSLSYFNEAAGGPRNGPEHLLKSSIDWGQDLLFLQEWIQLNKVDKSIFLAFDNSYAPFDLEIDNIEPWPFAMPAIVDSSRVPDGYYAISVNLLYEFPWAVYDRSGIQYFVDIRPLAHLRKQTPVGWAGYSIRIFSTEQMQEAYSATPSTPMWQVHH